MGLSDTYILLYEKLSCELLTRKIVFAFRGLTWSSLLRQGFHFHANSLRFSVVFLYCIRVAVDECLNAPYTRVKTCTTCCILFITGMDNVGLCRLFTVVNNFKQCRVWIGPQSGVTMKNNIVLNNNEQCLLHNIVQDCYTAGSTFLALRNSQENREISVEDKNWKC